MALGTIICFLLLSLIYIRPRVNGAVKRIQRLENRLSFTDSRYMRTKLLSIEWKVFIREIFISIQQRYKTCRSNEKYELCKQVNPKKRFLQFHCR